MHGTQFLAILNFNKNFEKLVKYYQVCGKFGITSLLFLSPNFSIIQQVSPRLGKFVVGAHCYVYMCKYFMNINILIVSFYDKTM